MRRSIVIHHHWCHFVVLETLVLALPVTHKFGFTPSSRTAHCTGNELNSLFSSTSTSMSCCWHDLYSCVSADPFRTTAFSCFREPLTLLPENWSPSAALQSKSTPSSLRHCFSVHLQSFGLQTPSFHLRRLGQCPKPLAPPLPPSFFPP